MEIRSRTTSQPLPTVLCDFHLFISERGEGFMISATTMSGKCKLNSIYEKDESKTYLRIMLMGKYDGKQTVIHSYNERIPFLSLSVGKGSFEGEVNDCSAAARLRWRCLFSLLTVSSQWKRMI